MATEERPWLYLGCGNQSGHYLFTKGDTPTKAMGLDPWLRDFDRFDGIFAPRPETELYVAAYFRMDGVGYSGLAWWDRTVDTRGKSNSTIFCSALSAEPHVVLQVAKRLFPWVFARLPKPLTLYLP